MTILCIFIFDLNRNGQFNFFSKEKERTQGGYRLQISEYHYLKLRLKNWNGVFPFLVDVTGHKICVTRTCILHVHWKLLANPSPAILHYFLTKAKVPDFAPG